MPKEVVVQGTDDPYALRTSLGWGVIGWVQSPYVESKMPSRFAYKTSAREICPNDVKEMFDLKFNESNPEQKMSAEDRQFLEIAKEGIHQRSDGHFEMPLPLKRRVSLPNNKSMAMMRLNHLKNRLSKDDAYKQEYVACLTDVIEKGYAELVPPSELQGQPGMVWYIPHHGVDHPKKEEATCGI